MWLSKRLKDVAEELYILTSEDKEFVINRVDRENSWMLKSLFDSLNEYMGILIYLSIILYLLLYIIFSHKHNMRINKNMFLLILWVV